MSSRVETGLFARAERYGLRAVSTLEDGSHERWQAQMYRYLCEVYARMGEFDKAKRAYQYVIKYFLTIRSTYMVAGSLRPVAGYFEAQGEYMKAVELLALQATHSVTAMSDVQQAKAALDLVRPRLSAEDFSAAYKRGKALDLDATIAELLAS